MLILTRSIGQRIIIGEDIYIDILNVKGMQVKIGIDAPKNIEVDREEVRNRKIRDPYPEENYSEEMEDSYYNNDKAANHKTPKISFKGKLRKLANEKEKDQYANFLP